MLAWLGKQVDGKAALAGIRALQAELDTDDAKRERDFILPFLRPGLLGAAVQLQRLPVWTWAWLKRWRQAWMA